MENETLQEKTRASSLCISGSMLAKYGFYAVYPVHLLILYFIKKAAGGY